eukprot:TRINITY_DN1759_c0_g1_i5.p1 TRINITY_DN1759_c0_g1~~TRINITY_DN1759_c0_g1_i5.p1  ORF type:complete len:275 (+),score=96.05 TRINITY_DN1759_c0_g1_i5:114-827(+)
MLRSLVGSEMCIRDSINAEYGESNHHTMFKVIAQKREDLTKACEQATQVLESGAVQDEAVHASLSGKVEEYSALSKDKGAKMKALNEAVKDLKEALTPFAAEGGAQAEAAQSACIIRLTRDLESLDLPPQATLEFPHTTHSGDKDITKFHITITPDVGYWKSGAFTFLFDVPPDYNYKPPKVSCVTRIYHPNIDTEGHVCLNVLREDWSAAYDMTACVNSLMSVSYTHLTLPTKRIV